MCIVCQTAMTVAAAVTAVVPGVGATQQSEPERPVAAVSAAPSLKGKCARVGQSRTVKGVRYVCSKSKRWQVASSGGSGTGTQTTTTTTTVARRNDPLADDFTTFGRALPRTTSNRPDDRMEQAQIKVIYAVPSFSTDRRRDTSGEISEAVFAANEWWAKQNGGFGLRFDTFQGALDVGYLEFTTTKQKWYDDYFGYVGERPNLTNGLSRFQSVLAEAGFWTQPRINGSNDSAAIESATRGKLFLVVVEAPAGTYARTGVNSGGCRTAIDAVNDVVPIIALATTQDDLASCFRLNQLGRPPLTGSVADQASWIRGAANFGMVDHIAQWMRNLPGCGYGRTPRDGERFRVPGVVDESRAWEIRGGFMRDLAEAQDPLAAFFNNGAALPAAPKFDVRNDLYFHITSDKLASQGDCNSDISKHPLWDNLPLDRDSGRTLLRSSYDRPDDIAGAQFHAVYVLRHGATDHAYDTSGDIERALRHADRWLRAESGKGMRLDTYQGKVDVTFLPLPPRFESTTGKDCSRVPCPNDQDFYAHLQSIGRVNPNKTYLFFYSGGLTGMILCGGAGVGKSVLLNLEVDGQFCSGAKWDEPTSTALSWGLLALHETFHSLGAVCPAAPDSDGAYHSKLEEDIMFARSKGNVKLDPNRRNYWGNVPAGCTDASQSPLFGG